jgi:hypothetical protein
VQEFMQIQLLAASLLRHIKQLSTFLNSFQ